MARRSDPFTLDITPELIVRAYRAGIFPMAESVADTEVFWVSPEMRGILPLDGFLVSRSLAKTLRRHDFEIRVDHDFDAVIDACAASAPGREDTWINPTIRRLYRALFDQGHCHTVEVYRGAALVGGLYGLSIGGAFFGESMFHRATDMSKVALHHLVERLNAGGYALLDTQFLTDHLASLGGIEIARARYEAMLAEALPLPGDFFALERIVTP